MAQAAQSPPGAPAESRGAQARERLARVPGAVWVVAIALATWLIQPAAFPSYDYAFALSAGQDLLAGRETGYAVPIYSPVAHPLTIVVATLGVLTGAPLAAYTAWSLLGFGLLVWATARLGTAAGGWPVGLLGALAVAVSPVVFELGTRGYGDVMFAGLVLWATLIEARRDRAGWPVLALLAVGGLIRPEAWVLAAGYWVYLVISPGPDATRRSRLPLIGLVLVAPALWLLNDLIVSGDPLHSSSDAAAYADDSGRGLTLATLADETWSALDAFSGVALLAGALVGLAFAIAMRARVRFAIVVATVATLIAALGPATLMSAVLFRRFLAPSAALLALLWALAIAGFVRLRSPRERIGWGLAALAVALATLALAPDRIDHLLRDTDAQAVKVGQIDRLEAFVGADPARRVLATPACRPIYVPGYGFRPYLRLWLDVPARDVAFTFLDPAPARGSILLPTPAGDYQRLNLDGLGRTVRARVLATPAFRRTYRRVAADPAWDLYAGPACRASAARPQEPARG